MKAIKRWIFAPAAPWQFWMPMSGPYGGIIGSLILLPVLLFVFWLIGAPFTPPRAP